MGWALMGVLWWAGGLSAAPGTPPRTLDELLEAVRQDRLQENSENRAREARFLKDRDRRQALLEEARAALAREQQRSEALRAQHQAHEQAIAEQQERLGEAAGSLDELQVVFRQLAGDVAATLKRSVVTAETPERLRQANGLAASTELPSLEQLEALWQLMLEQGVASGRVTRFPAQVTRADGAHAQGEVVRIGEFNLISAGRYLRYLPESGAVAEFPRQPPARYRKLAAALEQAQGGVLPMVIDPTRGAMLSLLVQSPNLRERVRQGGVIGYIIIALGGVGLLIALERLVVLALLGRRVARQLGDSQPDPRNPLGRVLKVAQEHPGADTEALGLKLDEAVLRELPRLQRGLGTLSVLAAVAPLLGLLGTVTGIIETFQSITLFGTGDPRIMSGGISLALVTTVQGLVVAIPILLLHAYLSARSNRIIQVLDEKSLAIVAAQAEGAG
jgi:biopolymer transport protein ExbB